MTTRARAFYLLKSDKNDLKQLGHPTFIRLFKIRFHSFSSDSSPKNTDISEGFININTDVEFWFLWSPLQIAFWKLTIWIPGAVPTRLTVRGVTNNNMAHAEQQQVSNRGDNLVNDRVNVNINNYSYLCKPGPSNSTQSPRGHNVNSGTNRELNQARTTSFSSRWEHLRIF